MVSAIGNTKLNFNSLIGVHEFPTYRLPGRLRKSDKLDSSSASMVDNRGSSVVDNNIDNEAFFSPKYPIATSNRRLSGLKSQMGGFLGFKGPSFEPRRNFFQDLPDAVSMAWQEGFIWKGVFLKLYSKKEAEKLKKEMKALKHLGVEYLQTEAGSRNVDMMSHSAHNISEISDTGKQGNHVVTVLLPLVCTVESSSWVLLGTPVFPIKKSIADDQASKMVQESIGTFKNSFLLGNLTAKNFKQYYRPDENNIVGNIPSSTNINTNVMSSYLQGNSTASNTNHTFLLLSNVSNTLTSLPKVNVMFLLNQEANAHVTFLEFPKKRALDPQLIKQALGYSTKNIDTSLLQKKNNKQINVARSGKKGMFLDSIRFRRCGWIVQMVFVDANDELPSTFCRNKRACDLLSHSTNKW